MIRVMHVVIDMDKGGLQNVVLNLCRQIKHPEIEQLVCCLEAEGELVPVLKELGIPVFFMAKEPGLDFLLPFKLAHLFRKNRITVVHSHDTGANFYGALGGLIAAVKCLLKTEHGGINLATRRIMKFEGWLIKKMNKMITVSGYLKERVISRQGVESDRIMVIHNGIDADQYLSSVDLAAKRKELGFSPEDKIIFTVGRVVALKNIRLLIKAASRLRAEFPAIKIAIIGSGPEEEKLKKLTAEKNMADTVKFLGHRADISEIIPALDIFVLCSRFEGLGLVLLEAMAAKKPVAASNVGGIPEIVRDKQNGLLFASDSEDELAEALKKLLTEPELVNKLTRAGYQTACEDFSVREMAEAYSDVYRYHTYSATAGQRLYQSLVTGLRRLIKATVYNLWYFSGLAFLLPAKNRLRVVTYHRVVDRDDLNSSPVGLAVTRETFEKHLIHYKKYCHIIDEATLLNHRDNLSSLPRNALLITFDDGYIDNYEIALGIMKKHEIPGIIFVAANYIGRTRLFWSDIVAFILKVVADGELDAERIAGRLSPKLINLFSRVLDCGRPLAPKPYNDFMSRLKELAEREEIIGTMVRGAALEAEGIGEQKRYSVLSWEQLREMAKAGIVCGAHTLNHPDVTKISSEELRTELVEAKKIIEQKMGRSVDSFAYPYGFYDDSSAAEVEKAGYKVAFSLEGGDNKSLYRLRRLNVWEDSFKGAGGKISPALLKMELRVLSRG